jgi:hypothetical protein
MTKTIAERAYGIKSGKLEWIQAQVCFFCRTAAPSEAAHTKNGGMSRKGGSETLIPLCWECHVDQHRYGWSSMTEDIGFDPTLIAKQYHDRWLALCASLTGGTDA